uniref:Uncharacterized protein n=1 Tax=Lepeophtheirus salmonis TaxID=72036 RepID=A0A0K2U679_LEPSM
MIRFFSLYHNFISLTIFSHPSLLSFFSYSPPNKRITLPIPPISSPIIETNLISYIILFNVFFQYCFTFLEGNFESTLSSQPPELIFVVYRIQDLLTWMYPFRGVLPSSDRKWRGQGYSSICPLLLP